MMRLLYRCLVVCMVVWFTLPVVYVNAQTVTTTNVGQKDQIVPPLILALEQDYPPFLFFENGEPQGITFEYANLLAQKLGVTLTTSEPLQLQAMLDAVKNNQANLLSDITKTAERDLYLEFSKPFLETPAVVIGRIGDENKWTSGPIEGVTIAVGKGYGVVSYLKKNFPKVQLIELASDYDVMKSVALGASDLGVLDLGSLTYNLQKTPLSNLEVVAETGFTYALSFAVSENNHKIIPQINQAIDQITQTERTQIFAHWLSSVPRRDTSFFSKKIMIAISGFFAILSVVGLWALTLRRTLKKKTKELQILNTQLDQKVVQKTNEFLNLKNEADDRSLELEKTKKALLNVLEDVEAEKNKMAAITERLKVATESGQIGVWELDLIRQKVTWNDTMYTLFGIKKDSQANILNLWEKSIHPEDVASRKKSLDLALKKNKNYDANFRIILPSGKTRYIRGKGVVYRDKRGNPLKLVGVDWDVTKEKEVDEAKTEFVSLASHQLRTPLTAIRLFIDLLAKGGAISFSEVQKGYVQNIQLATMRMIQLVNDLLNISRLETGRLAVKPENNNLKKILENSEVFVQGLAHEFGCTLTNKAKNKKILDSPLDSSLINEVLVSLISNAVRYSPKDSGVVDLDITEKGADYVVSVKDNGIGIPLEAQENIFKKFFRADNAVQKEADGSGLGLYIARMIVETWSGKLWFETSSKTGTTFYFTVPIAGMTERQGEKGIAK